MLEGSFTVKVDDKGRVKLPAHFRKQIAESYGSTSFYVTSVRGECARLYPEPAWNKVRQRLFTQPPSKPAIRRFIRATSYYGQMASMDPQGRVLIHPRLREAADLDSEVVVTGHQDHLEVWNHKSLRGILTEDPYTDDDEDFISTLER